MLIAVLLSISVTIVVIVVIVVGRFVRLLKTFLTHADGFLDGSLFRYLVNVLVVVIIIVCDTVLVL